MECVFVAVLLVLLPLWPLIRMLLGKGPNSIRRLQRIDLAAFFVLTAGIALACGAARAAVHGEGAFVFGLIFVLALPMGLAAAWFVRFLIEDVAFHFAKSRRRFYEVSQSKLQLPGWAAHERSSADAKSHQEDDSAKKEAT